MVNKPIPHYKQKTNIMKAVGNYNKISPELQKLIPRLEPQKSVTFKMLNGIANNDPDNIERQKNPTFYPKSNIPMKDRIWDKFANNGQGEWIDIVVADGWDKGEPTRLTLYRPYEIGAVFTGKFSLAGGNSKDESIYEFLMLCNGNRDAVTGEDRDNTVTPSFGLVSVANDNKVSTNRRDILLQALNLTKDMKVADAQQFAASLNWNKYEDENELLTRVTDFAREKPEEFLKVYNDPTREFKSSLKEAMDAQIVSYDIQSGQFKLGDQLITTLQGKDRGSMLDAMGAWFQSAENGKSVLESVKKQLKEKKKPEMA